VGLFSRIKTMSPERKDTINGKKIEEYYWNGKLVVYVDNHSVDTTFEETCNTLRTMETGMESNVLAKVKAITFKE
jgi:hypothetical protein